MRYEGVSSCESRQVVTDMNTELTNKASVSMSVLVGVGPVGADDRAQQTVQKGTSYALLVLVVAFCQFWLLRSLWAVV